jgi:hypothetical protein
VLPESRIAWWWAVPREAIVRVVFGFVRKIIFYDLLQGYGLALTFCFWRRRRWPLRHGLAIWRWWGLVRGRGSLLIVTSLVGCSRPLRPLRSVRSGFFTLAFARLAANEVVAALHIGDGGGV